MISAPVWLLVVALGCAPLALGPCECTACDPSKLIVHTKECAAGTCHEVSGPAAGQCRASPSLACGASCEAGCPPGYNASGTTDFVCENMCGDEPARAEQAGFGAGSGKEPASLFTAFKQSRSAHPWLKSTFSRRRRTTLESKTGSRSRRRRVPGRWSAGTLTCTLSECSASTVPLPEHAEWGAGTDPGCRGGPGGRFLPAGTVCNATCSEGYYRSDGVGARTCRINGPNGDTGWSGDLLVCTRDGTCSSEPDSNSHWLRGSSKCGATRKASCNAGYQRGWDASGKPTVAQTLEYTCECPDGENPRWTLAHSAGAPCLGCTDDAGAPVECACDGPPTLNARDCRGKAGASCAAECLAGFGQVGDISFYMCDNRTGVGSWVGGNLLRCERVHPSRATSPWDIICMCTTVISALCIPAIIRRYNSRLEAHDVEVPEEESASGWPGMIMFVHGILDLCADSYLCLTLFTCDRGWLSLSAVATLLLSTATTLYLGFGALMAMERESPEARAWHIRNNRAVTFVLIVSCCRIESIAILRLRLFGRMVIDFPIAPKHFHFLRYSGWFHAILADIPHLLVATALLVDSRGSCEEMPAWLPLTATEAAALSILFSCGSIVWGAVSRTGQWVVARAHEGSLRESLLGAAIQEQLADLRRQGLVLSVTGADEAATGPARDEGGGAPQGAE
eukprot:COSAG04_NODE_1609_length_6174_cov_10.786864_1_plen_680_part_00